MIEKERYQELLDIGYTETQIKKILEKDEFEQTIRFTEHNLKYDEIEK